MTRSVKTDRVHYIDWLRTFGILLVFLFHCSKYFSLDDFPVKNHVTSRYFSELCGFLQQWGMPLFFVISGMSAYFAMG